MQEQQAMTPSQVGGAAPLGAAPMGLVLLARDPTTNRYYELALDGINAQFLPGERVLTIDKLDSRNGVAVTVPNKSAVNAVVSGVIEVPAGEVWYINRMGITCPAADATGTASFNVLVSPWPKTAAGADKGYYAAAQTAMGAVTKIELPAQGELGEELRLKGGDKLTLSLLVTVAFTADKIFRLDVYGRKCKKILV